MRRVDVYNREQACALAARPDVAVISISGPGKAAPLAEGWREVLRLEFHDIDPKWGVILDNDGKPCIPFDESHVEQVFAFAERNSDCDLVIHCDAGVSRSVATGLFISNEFGGELHTHAIHTTRAANGHVLTLLNRRVWHSHFNTEVK